MIFFPARFMSKIARAFAENKVEAVFGDIAFVRPGRLDK